MPRTTRRLAELIHNTGPDRLVPILENTGPDNTVETEKDDLKPEIVSRLSRFASDLTVATQNEFPLTNIRGTFGLEDTTGNPSGLRDPGENAQDHYSGRFRNPSTSGISAEREFNQTSDSGLLDVDNAKGGRFIIKKGRSSLVAPTGTDIYEEVNERGENSNFVKRVRQVQFDNNRFTLGKTFVPRTGLELADGIPVKTPGSDGSGTVEEDDSNIGVAYSQQDFGKHGPRKFPRTEGDTAVLLKIKDLKKLGLLTMLEASGEYYIPTDPTDVGQQVAARGTAFAPGLARIGQKINMTRVSPVKIMKDINPNYQKPNLDDNIKRGPVLSYGNVNNWMTPFSGLSSTASVACAALLTLTIGGLLKGAALLVSPRSPSSPVVPGANLSTNDRRKRLGSYLGKLDQVSTYRNADYVIRATITKHDYFQAVSRGIDIFFGTSSIPTEAVQVIQNHGYYNTVLRSLIRGTKDMIMQAAGGISNIEGATSINDVGLLGNPVGPIELVRKINESQLLKFCNIMATIGDVALSHEQDGFITDENGGIAEFISDIDRIVVEADVGPKGDRSLNPAILQSVNKLPGQYRNALAWGSNTSKSMYMIPNGLSRAESNFLGSTNQAGNPSETMTADLSGNKLHVIKGPDKLDGNRISAEDVKSMEEHLEADYMPFYFHDLRTNELISFHAFLEDMNDGFDVDYTETEGYGRIGSVHTYKNTKRTISLSFRIVATNHKDFDHMWFKINKLVTLVYPQYTEGRQIGTPTEKFIQPFSQVPSASPLIRLRLGDLFKTNYSKFALARLFGVGSSQFSLQGQSGNITRDVNLAAAREQVTNRMAREADFHVGEHAMITPLPSVQGRGVGQRILGYPRVGSVSDTVSQPGQSIRNGVGGRRGAGAQGFVSTVSAAGGRAISAVASPAGAPLQVTHQTRVRISRVIQSDSMKIYHFTIPNGGFGQDGIYQCTQFDLMADPSEITRVATNQVSSQTSVSGSTQQTNSQNAVTTFFNSTGDNGNPVVKAFESTKGKGLAGFIKSLKFDWSDARWETGRQNARAPMSVKVAIDFAPIYDINPGLDSEGFMTSPVYNTGETIKVLTEMPDQRMQNNTDRANMDRATTLSYPRSGNGSVNSNGSGAVGGLI
jgi:hypothetical protein